MRFVRPQSSAWSLLREPHRAVLGGLLIVLAIVLLAVPAAFYFPTRGASLSPLSLGAGQRLSFPGSEAGSLLKDSDPLFWAILNENLRPFQKAGITREDIERAAAAHPAGHLQQRLLIHGNRLYIKADEPQRDNLGNYFHKMVFHRLLCRRARSGRRAVAGGWVW